MHIELGERINALRIRRNISVEEIAERMGTTPRNMYHIFKKNDMFISQLWIISETLNYNFFDIIKPDVTKTPELIPSTLAKDLHTLNLEVEYFKDDVENVGKFLKNVHALAAEFGYRLK